MRDFQRKRGWRNILESRPVLVVLIILLGAFAWGVLGFFNKMQVTRDNKKIAESKFMELKTQQEKLSSDIAKLQTEKGVEENIRDKFGLAKEGEGLIVVLDDKDNKEAEVIEDEGFWSFFTNFFR